MNKHKLCIGSLLLAVLPILAPSTGHTAEDANRCDYTNAALYSGWGWNASSSQSCAPIVCEAQYMDVDGDGFGIQEGQTCTVTSETLPPPVAINKELGTAVELTRVYWDGNADIANRTIQCDSHIFISTEQKYIAQESYYLEGRDVNIVAKLSIKHLPLSPEAPNSGWMLFNATEQSPAGAAFDPNWSVEDGIYKGSVLQNPYLELIVRPDGAKGVRNWSGAFAGGYSSNRWAETDSNNDYYECWDQSGADLTPTGTFGILGSQATLSNLEFTVESETEDNPDEIIDVATGEPRPLVKAYWNYNRDLAGGVTCGLGHYSGNIDVEDVGYYRGMNYSFPHHFTNSGNTLFYRTDLFPDYIQSTGSFEVTDDAVVRRFIASEYVELADGKVRSWHDSSHFTECNVTPTGSAQQQSPTQNTDDCNYSNADIFNGWGWDPVSRKSCPPLQNQPDTTTETDTCNYANAAQYDGWGWNAVTGQSCAPRSQDSAPDCIDSDGDGWGWDGTKSCRM